MAFSILGRIEPTATRARARERPRALRFQYPRSDRAHCNLPLWNWVPGCLWSTFSILGRIEPTATSPLRRRGSCASPLSVSSVGSSPLQHGCGLRPRGRSGSFSILGRIEPTATRASVLEQTAWCTFSILGRIEPTATWRPWILRRRWILSVSSVGSSPLQLLRVLRLRATQPLSVSSVGSSPLQRGNAIVARAWVEWHFQYPRSDRAHCNGTRPTVSASPSRTFSILGRIEPTATVVRPSPRDALPPFSILGRIEPTATT